MCFRVIFAVRNAIRHHQRFREFAAYATLNDIDFSQLKNNGVTVLVLDFDGVLASHGKVSIDDSVKPALESALNTFEKVYVLSNKPFQERILALKQQYPSIGFHIAAKKKPYPDGLIEIATTQGVDRQSMMLIDDRLLTGGLAAILAKTRFCFINQPLVDYKAKPVVERFFSVLRTVERRLFL